MKKYAFLVKDYDGEWQLTSRDGKVCYEDRPNVWEGQQAPTVVVGLYVPSTPLYVEGRQDLADD
jgi:hypothetical protein